MMERRRRVDAKAAAQTLRRYGPASQSSYMNRLDRLSCPTLLIVGAEDEKFCAGAEKMRVGSAQIAIERIPDAGHTVHLEQPEHFVRVLKAFVSEA
jgi:2-succinyl-6-hydroxy-2,4-cyclohexadiene-1-carboxylate synthase